MDKDGDEGGKEIKSNLPGECHKGPDYQGLIGDKVCVCLYFRSPPMALSVHL